VTECLRSSASVLHKRWTELEEEHHELAITIDAARARKADLARMREGKRGSSSISIRSSPEIRDAPATTLEDFCALLDVALEHEIDLACDIAFCGPDFPMIRRLLRALPHDAPGCEFNSLRRWLSPGQLEQLMGGATRLESAGSDPAPVEPSAFVAAIRNGARKRG